MVQSVKAGKKRHRLFGNIFAKNFFFLVFQNFRRKKRAANADTKKETRIAKNGRSNLLKRHTVSQSVSQSVSQCSLHTLGNDYNR